MTPGEQVALMKAIETLDACVNQDPTAKDLKVQHTLRHYWHLLRVNEKVA